jgi:hypothetical protein
MVPAKLPKTSVTTGFALEIPMQGKKIVFSAFFNAVITFEDILVDLR